LEMRKGDVRRLVVVLVPLRVHEQAAMRRGFRRQHRLTPSKPLRNEVSREKSACRALDVTLGTAHLPSEVNAGLGFDLHPLVEAARRVDASVPMGGTVTMELGGFEPRNCA